MDRLRSTYGADPSQESGALKARLFGRDQGDPIQRALIKARLLAGLGPVGEDPGPDGLGRPVRIGRYRVTAKLGQGGMGVVYAGHDEQLDRRVALKLLRAHTHHGVEARARMLREAQALARLSHPNVVQVYEVGRWREHDYVVMELVDGRTFDAWVAEPGRRWQDIVEVLRGAGRGLEAAHAAGLVHRDFKPSNLLIGVDGRARVLDFGLARRLEEPGPEASASAVELAAGGDSQETPVTGAGMSTSVGVVVGTPAYMAPEQLRGQPATPASDQFSFCVVAFEALFGQRPFAAATHTDYLAKLAAGDMAPIPTPSRVPLWLRRVVVRGLAHEPSQRWPAMAALLAELDRDRARPWRWLAAGASVAIAFGAAWLTSRADGPDRCAIDPSAIAEAWGPGPRDAVADAFARSGLAGAELRLAQIEQHLDGYADALQAGRARACEDRWQVGGQTDAQWALREACLDQRERELTAVVAALREADREAIVRAPELLGGLGDIDVCARVDLLAAGTPAPQDEAVLARIAAVRDQIAQAHAARDVGRLSEAQALTAEAWRAAEPIGFEPLTGQLHLLAARNARTARDMPAAREHLRAAVVSAQRSGQLELLAEVWAALAFEAASAGADPDTSLEFVLAATALEQLGSPPRRRVALGLARGLAWLERGRAGAAVAELDQVVDAVETELDDELLLVRVLTLRARGLASLGNMSAARADLERVTGGLGMANRDQLDARFDLAVLELEAGELDDAEADFRVAMAGYAALFGPGFESIGHGHLALTNIALAREDYVAARAELDRALAVFGDEHADRDWALDALAAVQLQSGETDAGIATLRQAIALRQRLAPEDHARAAYLRTRLAIGLLDARRDADALAEAELAVAGLDRPEVELPLDLARALQVRGEALLRLDRADEAVRSLERAVELTPPDCGDVVIAGESRVLLAMALAELGVRADERRALARAGADLIRDWPSRADLRELAASLQ